MTRVTFQNPLPDVGHRGARFHVHAKHVHRVVVPVFDEQASIHQDRALLVGIVDHDADDGQADQPVRRRNLEHFAERQMLKLRRGCPTRSDLRPPPPCRYISSAFPATGCAMNRSARCCSSRCATTMTGVFRNVMRPLRSICTRSTPGSAAISGAIVAGNLVVRTSRLCDGRDEEIGIEDRVHPIDDRVVVGASPCPQTPRPARATASAPPRWPTCAAATE